MKKGFTILELLVASLLLGMLMTILTMIFNQSSIAWRTGLAGVADLDEARSNMARVREEADNLYLWDGEMYRLLGLWDRDGNLRGRAISDREADGYDSTVDRAEIMEQRVSGLTGTSDPTLDRIQLVRVGQGDAGNSLNTYSVNVMCLGPDKEFDTWDDIWSYPDDFE